MSRKVLWIGLLLAAVVMALLIVQRRRWPQPGERATVSIPKPPAPPAIRGKPAADFALPSLDGNIVRRADFKNKVLLVNFWATWCAPCLIEIPWFLEFQKQYGPQGLEIIGISLDEESPKKVQEFVQEHKMVYTVLMGDEQTTEAFGGILGLPTSFLVDRDGKYYSMHRGLVSKEIVEDELQALLGPPGPNQPESSGPSAQQEGKKPVTTPEKRDLTTTASKSPST